jgi:hypothetical protein
MSALPPESLQPIAVEIARAMLTNDLAQIESLCESLPETLGSLVRSESAPPADAGPAAGRIGIWTRDPSDPLAPYRRIERLRRDWRLWADIDAIDASPGRRRIVLLGESAARGYFYDPVFAPATVIEGLLRRAPALAEVTVVDLARSNIDPGRLVALADQARQLEPELFILFAGNNWASSATFDSETRRHLLAEFVADGYRGYVAAVEVWRKARTELALDYVGAIAAKAGVPVIVVVPETNLLDWHEERLPIVPVLPDGRGGRWRALAKRALAALDDGRIGIAASMAADLIALDEETSPVGPAILGRCGLSEGDIDGARNLFEKARDTLRALPIESPPGCAQSIQAGLRRAGERKGFRVIDLPAVMRERLGGGLPGRRYFLDYCHLTSAGIALLAEKVVEAALPLLGVTAPVDLAVEAPSHEIEAGAHFMAAVHCSRWHQAGDLIDWHCREALRLSPDRAKERMRSYVEVFGRPGPPWLGAGFPVLAGSRGTPTYRYFCEISPLADEELREPVLAEVIAATLGERQSAPHGEASGERVDLLLRHHFAAGSINSMLLGRVRRAFVTFHEPVSRFIIRLAEPGRYRLDITWRMQAVEGGTVAVHLNEDPLGALPASEGWISAKLDDLALPAGRNELVIVWPSPVDGFDDHRRRAAAAIARNAAFDPLVGFAEVHRLRLVPEADRGGD